MDLETILELIGGSAISQYGLNARTRKQRELNKQLTSYKLGKSAESTAATEKYLASLTPEARKVENPALKAEAEKSARESLGTTMAYEKPRNFAGKTGTDYDAVLANEKAIKDQRVNRAIDQMTTLAVPTQRALADNVRFNTGATDVGQVNRNVRNVEGAYHNAMDLAQPNRVALYAGQVLRGMGLADATKRKAPKPQTSFVQEPLLGE